MTTAEISLRDFAKANRLRVTTCNYYNPNAGKSALFQTKVQKGMHQITLRAAAPFVIFDLHRLELTVSFSVNKPDCIVGLNKRIRGIGSQLAWPLYIGDVIDPQIVSKWLRAKINCRYIAALTLGARESLQVYRNGATLIVEATRDLANTINSFVALANILPEANSEVVLECAYELPKDIRHLRKFFAKWACSDDTERDEVLARSRRAQRERLCNAVVPLFPQINAYLDSFSGPLPECAIRLGNLAELVAEVQRA